MDLLRVSFTLQKVDVLGTPREEDGKDAVVQEVLQLAGYFSVLRESLLPFGGAKAGGVFMWGAPFAGKMDLNHRMMKTVQCGNKFESWISIVEEILISWRGMRELAEQEIFRALQDILFLKIYHGKNRRLGDKLYNIFVELRF